LEEKREEENENKKKERRKGRWKRRRRREKRFRSLFMCHRYVFCCVGPEELFRAVCSLLLMQIIQMLGFMVGNGFFL
jgi:hypothetical protein